MPADTELEVSPSAPETGELAKRKQIIEGARRVFFGQGFAAASMGEIARESKVSKGTLYVYFDSKEALFAAIVEEAKGEAAEHTLRFDPDDPDVRATLTSFGVRLIRKLIAPRHVAMVRMVIGAAEQFPDLAGAFYEAGPEHGKRALAAYLEGQDKAGRLAVPDPGLAAWQLLGMFCHPVTVGVVLAARPAPDEARIDTYAKTAVETFLTRYGVAA